MEAAQTLAWPSPYMHAPTKATAAKVRPISAAGAPVVCSDVPQALNLQSWWGRCKSVPKQCNPCGSGVVSAPPLHVGNPLVSASGAAEVAVVVGSRLGGGWGMGFCPGGSWLKVVAGAYELSREVARVYSLEACRGEDWCM